MKKETTMPNFIKLETDILEFWKQNKSFEKLVKKNEGKPRYKFLDGPITANNEMGIHHVWGRTLKDLNLKYKSMKGYSCHFQNGFDAHGTPVEVNVEKELGIQNKKELVDYGLNEFVDACLKRVEKYSKIQTEQSIRLGQWMDWEDSYFTNTDENITAIWHFLKICQEKGWLKLSYKPMMWCPRCGTSLSDHEMTGSYKDTEHTAVFFKLPIKQLNAKILVWTTTPWTLSSNVAVAVNPNNDYLLVKVKSDELPVIVGKEAVKVLKDDKVEVLKTFKGSELVNLEYQAVFNNLEIQDFTHKIVSWDDVSAEEGTGAVHIAPGCGQEDHELGEKLGLKAICPINEAGEFLPEFEFLAGLKTGEAAQVIFDELEKQNKLYYTHKFKHSYPVCWRCKNEIVFRLVDSWCIQVDEIRPRLIEEVEKVEWQPKFLKKRMLDWLNNMGEWHISRSRFYGVPLPIYPCECGHTTVVGSKEELANLSSSEEVENIPHLHRPHIDKVEINCPKCNKKVKRITDVGDTWLDAGITPFSTKKYFTDKKFWKQNFPADNVIEMREQIRLWFYSLLFMSVTLENRAPYKKVIAHAAVIKEDGGKFSKSGYMIKVNDVADKMGMDPARYLYASANINSDVRFGFNLGAETRRKLLGLWNSYTFFNTYAVIDNPQLENYKPDYNNLSITDKWLVSITNEFITTCDNYYKDNQAFNVTSEFEKYLDKLTNFYIRVNRRRFWKSDNETDKLNAYWVLYNAIKSAIQVISPIIPFMTEHIWQNMVRQVEVNAPESIFLSDYPKYVLNIQDKDIIKHVQVASDVINIGQRLRAENQLKVKQPLSKIFIKATQDQAKAIKLLEEIIKDELNVKQVETVEDETRFNVAYLTVNFNKAGRVLKGDVQKVKVLLENTTKEKMQEYVEQHKEGTVNIEGYGELSSELFDKKLKAKQEYVIAVENDLTVVLDTVITKELKQEGLLRDIIRQAQILRKEANFNIEDRINASFKSDNQEINEILNKFEDHIKQEVLIKNLNTGFKPTIEKEFEVDNYKINIKMGN